MAARFIASPYALAAAVAMLVIDVIWQGMSICALLCPLWMLVILVRLAIRRRGSLAAVVHLALAASVMTASLVNSGREERLMEEQLRTLEKAICRFHEATGKWPERMDELVPRWLDRLPPTPAIPLSRRYSYVFCGPEPPFFMHSTRIGWTRGTWVGCNAPVAKDADATN